MPAAKWREINEATKNIIWNDANNELSHFRKLADEAFNRKSKLLTAGNAGGVITVITFIGTINIGLGCYVLFSILLFILGLVLNGFALFLAEKRFNNFVDGLIKARDGFMKYNSEMTQDDYNNEISNINETPQLETILELLSGLAFLVGVVFVFIAAINN